jgi:hypothetical protein
MIGYYYHLKYYALFLLKYYTQFLATSDEVVELKKENQRLKVMIADLVLRYDIVKKSLDMLD